MQLYQDEIWEHSFLGAMRQIFPFATIIMPPSLSLPPILPTSPPPPRPPNSLQNPLSIYTFLNYLKP